MYVLNNCFSIFLSILNTNPPTIIVNIYLMYPGIAPILYPHIRQKGGKNLLTQEKY